VTRIGLHASAVVLAILAIGASAPTTGTAATSTNAKVCYKRVKSHGKLVRKRVACPKPKKVAAPAPPPPPPPAPGSVRAVPLPLVTQAAVANWKVTVNSVTFDDWSAIEAANEFNDPPPAGWSDVVISLTMVYTGSSTGTPWLDNDLNVVGASNVAYPDSAHDCGVPPSPSLLDFNSVFPGGSVTGNVCIQVQTGDEASLVGYWNDPLGSGLGPWFALR
jgi:hypothetical protein